MCMMAVVMAVVGIRLWNVSAGRRGQSVVHARSCPPFDQLEGVIEYAI